MSSPKVGIYGFTGCAGDQLMILNCEDRLVDIIGAVDIHSFAMAKSDNQNKELDVAFVEGSISTEEQLEHLKDIRSRAKVVVAIGTCACWGGPQAMKLEEGGFEDRYGGVYGDANITVTKAFEAQPVDAFVEVDMKIPGCPIDKTEFLSAVSKVVAGRHPYFYKFPVCTECKWKENPCILNEGKFCAGPLTKAGCGAVCPSHNIPCVGCWGPTDDLNLSGEYKLLVEKGYDTDEIMRKFKKFGGAGIAKLIKSMKDEQRGVSE
ncbi:MAG: NADH:ubiquinone oxidoreductase [Methanobacteriota archaeon]|nr:MAG: NADH:ubiquinone oxidoreductase [Euryarchaeota archaeon]